MKNRYRVFRRGWGTFYCEDLVTKQADHPQDPRQGRSLPPRRRQERNRGRARRSACIWRGFIGRPGDPAAAKRTWQHVMDEIPKLKTGDTQHRWLTAIKDKAFDSIRNMVVLETQAEHFLKVLENGSVSTNIYLRRIHNFALDMNWLPWPVLPKKRWPAIKFKEKRGITLEEHQAIVARELNPERKAFYQLAWHLGASQSDIAFLEAENIDWENHVISFARKKTGSIAIMRFDEDMAEILRDLPGNGPLFPYLRSVRAGDRATEFKQRCVGLGIKGVTLHSYRYAWAERAKTAGYPERFAQEALGHNSKAVHRAYSRKAKVELPSLGEYERQQKLQAKTGRQLTAQM